ncbi:hypothetical protein PMAC_000606 [Pneumocystis sp. 'macacae']|nr:hypothetical protein PMAC_000606 [Pneumocystis sp. 'macacae']
MQNRGAPIVQEMIKGPEYGVYAHIYTQERPGQFRGGHKTSHSVQQPMQKIWEDVSVKRKTYSGSMRRNKDYQWEQATDNAQRSSQAKERSFRTKEQGKEPKSGIYASPKSHLRSIEAQHILLHHTVGFKEGARWRAEKNEGFKIDEDMFRSCRRPEKSSRASIKTYIGSLHELSEKSSSNSVSLMETGKLLISQESRDKSGLSRSSGIRRQHRMSVQHIGNGISAESRNTRVEVEKRDSVVSKNRKSEEKNEYFSIKKDSPDESEYFCKGELWNEKRQSQEESLCDKKMDSSENVVFCKEKTRSLNENTCSYEDTKSLDAEMESYDKSKGVYNENEVSNNQKSVYDDSNAKENAHDQKLTTILSIVKEMSKTNTADLSLSALQNQISKISKSSPNGSEKHSRFSKVSSFSTSSLSQKKKKSKDLEQEFFEKNASSKAALFRRSIFGNYIMENTFDDIKSSLKDIIRHSKSFNKEFEDIPSPCLDRFPKRNDTQHETFIKSLMGVKNNYFKDFVKRPLSVYDSFKFSIPLSVSKEDQVNSSFFSDKSSDHKISLQETSNINNSIESKVETKLQERQTMHKKLASLVSLKFLKDVDA